MSVIKLDFITDEGFGSRARLGLIVLESDQTLEVEARLINLDGVDFYHSRIPNEMEVTPTTLTDMAARLPTAAGLLPTDFGFDAIGYGCTSAATLIGTEGVTNAIRQAHPGMACTNPIAAAIAGFEALAVKRVAIVTPYTLDVTEPVADVFRHAGLEVGAVGSFLESSDLVVARISADSIAHGIRTVAAAARDCDGVFVSCTSLRTLDLIPAMEAEIGKPIVSSNQALLWHLLRLGGVNEPLAGMGRLFAAGGSIQP